MSLVAQTPDVKISMAEEIVRELYGLAPSSPTQQLPSERDQNFLIESAGDRFVLKISNAAQDRELLVAQNEMIERLGAIDPPRNSKSVPVIDSLNGKRIESVKVADQQHLVRLIRFVAGKPMARLTRYSNELLKNLGITVGQMTNALDGYDHRALHYKFHWDLAHGISVVESRLELIEDDAKRELVELLLHRFKRETSPLLADLPQSAIHNDANDGNLIVETTGDSVVPNRIAGVIDFGDAVWSWTVGELAIASAYAILEHADPTRAICQVVDGYQTERRLLDNEASALFGLACMRLCTSVVMAAEQQRQRPDNPYLSVSQAAITNTLPLLEEIPFAIASAMIKERCGLDGCARAKRVSGWFANQPEFAFPLGDSRPADDELLVMDLGVESQHMSGEPAAITEPELSRVINGALLSSSAKIAVGRYLEPRLIYDSELFVSDDFAVENRTIHLGMDLFDHAGTQVTAPLDGEVILFNDNSAPLDYGPIVILKHATDEGDEFYSLYGHLARDSVQQLKVGQKVNAGNTFAKLGESHENGGWPPHLHFQLVVDLLGLGTDFPGVCRASQVSAWRQFSPDPNLILNIPNELFPRQSLPKSTVLAKREDLLGGNLSIQYQCPIKAVRGYMQYIYDENGQKYIDAYNNVPHVGHCHPRVVEALRTHARRLNTNTRYLSDGVIEYAEALAGTMPDGLEVCFFLNSASEASELALRMAREKTRAKDLIVLEGVYHGHTTSLIEISPYKHDGPGGQGAPDWVHTAPVADVYRGPFRDPDNAGANYAVAVDEILDHLKSQGRALSAFMAESCPSVAGQILLPRGYLSDVYSRVRAAGGICIADDVQTGLGRLGQWFYGFEQQEVVPDIVVLGKPIGNGHPIAAVVTTREIADAFDNGMEFFSTFGGNTVSAAVGKSVLDIVKDEALPTHAEQVGDFLLSNFRELQQRHTIIGDVRGSGLFLGIELVRDRETLEPADREATYMSNRMRDRRILIGIDGPFNNVLKIRPPMPFSIDNAKELLRALESILGELD